MERQELKDLWADMWAEGNWIPSWPDSLRSISADEAAWTPSPDCHSVWQEVVHVIFWRRATLQVVAGGPSPTKEEVKAGEFASPSEVTEEAWTNTVDALRDTHDAIAALIEDPSADVTRVRYHILHDAYHLGRITQLRAMRGTPPKF